jgi:serralysin
LGLTQKRVRLTGTPTSAEAGSHVIAVTASDGIATSAADSFTLTIPSPAGPVDPKGSKGDDDLLDDGRDNVLDGKKGNDKLTGKAGADTFVLGKNYGRDVIRGFDPAEGDRIDLSGAVGIKGFNDLMKHHVTDTGDPIKISADDGSVLVILNLEPDALARDMFVF